MSFKHFRKSYCAVLVLLAAISLTGCSVSIDVSPEATSNIAVADNPEGSSDNAGTSIDTSSSDEPDDELPLTLRDAIASPEGLGEDAICGTCLGLPGIKDDRLMELVEDNFNAVTLENELKPESMLGKGRPAGESIHEEEVNGKTISVPTLDHSSADAVLDKITEHNEKHPDKPILVRGHVLVWHSQTPEWFFHVDYDRSKDYVSPEEMNERLEWYIRSMLEYYTGPDSKYNGLFYGWDVVNEAVSDRTGTYRNDTEDSIWWKVYGSNEYIINAFRYANMYAPSDLDLYYNDYNECDAHKLKGIISLIDDVKAAEGTRITGFGMQGHYSVYFPTADRIEECARAYAETVDKIMLTELDTKTSMLFNGNKEELPKEYDRQAKYYKSIYEAAKRLKADGIDIAGITFWGTVDKYSWLQQSGTHYPLLFDSDYNAKPAYYSFTDPDMISSGS